MGWIALAAVLIPVVTLVDVATGNELSFSLFYLIPISLAAWHGGERWGIAFSIVAAVIWGVVDALSGHNYSNALIYYWNSAIRLGFFLIITILLVERRRLHRREADLARTDFLTGIANSRLFHEVVEGERGRAERYQRPFAVAYIDLDDFKRVNDRLGHAGGDECLRAVARVLRQQLRREDLVARLGGDEFAVLLPEATPDAAVAVGRKMHDTLTRALQRIDGSLTCSVGLLSCVAAPARAEDVIRMADALMYAAKEKGKNALTSSVYSG